MRSFIFVFSVLAVAGCAPPKILVDHSYTAADKSIEGLMQQSGDAVGVGAKKGNLFNWFMRVCTQGADNSLSNCKDTVLLENVDPQSF